MWSKPGAMCTHVWIWFQPHSCPNSCGLDFLQKICLTLWFMFEIPSPDSLHTPDWQTDLDMKTNSYLPIIGFWQLYCCSTFKTTVKLPPRDASCSVQEGQGRVGLYSASWLFTKIICDFCVCRYIHIDFIYVVYKMKYMFNFISHKLNLSEQTLNFSFLDC